MCCSGGRHPPAAGAELKILIFGAGGSSIRPLGTISKTLILPIGAHRPGHPKGTASLTKLNCTRVLIDDAIPQYGNGFLEIRECRLYLGAVLNPTRVISLRDSMRLYRRCRLIGGRFCLSELLR